MKRVAELADQVGSMSMLVELTGVFEGLASMRISQVKDQVIQSTLFYHELWAIYSQIRIGNEFNFGREKEDKGVIDKELLLIITAEGGFGGDIDQKLVNLMLKDYQADKNEIIVIGHHGTVQLRQRSIAVRKYYRMPSRDTDINVLPIIAEIRKYRSTKVYYQEYISLMVQDVKRVELSSAINTNGEAAESNAELINEITYIFEPSSLDVVLHLERSMMQITISQLILESKLAQYASRFQAMRFSNSRAQDMKKDLNFAYNRAKRSVKDERLKEIVNGLKKARAGAGA